MPTKDWKSTMTRYPVFTRRTALIASAAGATAFVKADASFAQERAPPRTYVLIHGGWYGGWVWRDVVPALRAIGHVASAPTMTGVGERKHLISDTVGLTTNIDDIVNHIEMEGLHDIHLVGWSYGGMVATGVLARLSGRIRSVIYLDAFVPENGKALADYVAPPVRERFLKAAAEKQHITPIPFDVFGVKDARVVEYCIPRLVRQPWLSLTEPVKALQQQPDIPHTYIRCTGYDPSSFATFYERFKSDPRWDTQLLASSHVCMLEHPKETVKLLANAR